MACASNEISELIMSGMDTLVISVAGMCNNIPFICSDLNCIPAAKLKNYSFISMANMFLQ